MIWVPALFANIKTALLKKMTDPAEAAASGTNPLMTN